LSEIVSEADMRSADEGQGLPFSKLRSILLAMGGVRLQDGGGLYEM